MNLTMNQTQMTIDSVQMMQEQYNVMKEVSAAQKEMFSVFYSILYLIFIVCKH